MLFDYKSSRHNLNVSMLKRTHILWCNLIYVYMFIIQNFKYIYTMKYIYEYFILIYFLKINLSIGLSFLDLLYLIIISLCCSLGNQNNTFPKILRWLINIIENNYRWARIVIEEFDKVSRKVMVGASKWTGKEKLHIISYNISDMTRKIRRTDRISL